MNSLTPDFLSRQRFDSAQLAAMRSLGEHRGRQALFLTQSPQVLEDLKRAVSKAVFEMLSDNRDSEIADRLFKDGEAMNGYTRLVFKLLASGIDRDDLMGMSG